MTNCTFIADFIHRGGIKPIRDGQPDDLFVACASFEDRSTAVSECMVGNYRAENGVLYVNSEFQNEGITPETIRKISVKLQENVRNFSGVTTGTWEDAAKQFLSLRSALVPNGKSEEELAITIDITTFNREALLATLTIIRWGYPRARVRLAYVSPKEYNPRGRLALSENSSVACSEIKEETANVLKYLWLSRGFRKMRNAIGFPGVQRPQNPSLVILLPGFEVERALTIVENLEPSMVLLGKAADATRDIFYERSLEAKAQMLQLFQSRQPVVEFEFSCKKVVPTFEILSHLLGEYSGKYNTFISPMSTKPAVIASFLAAEQFPNAQITYSIPGEYNISDYSGGIHEIGFFELPLKVM